MPQSDLDELTGRTTDGVSRTRRYLQMFDEVIASVRVGDHARARRCWAALPRWDDMSEAEHREIEQPLIHKFEKLADAYAAAPLPPDDRDDEISVRENARCRDERDQLQREVTRLAKTLAETFANRVDRAAFDLLAAEVKEMRALALGMGDLRDPRVETQETISQWAESTFGPGGTNARTIARANREMAELLEHVTADDKHPEAAEEVADIMIVLYRVATRLGVDLHERIDAKMARNRVRKWKRDGTGHGYHVKAEGHDGVNIVVPFAVWLEGNETDVREYYDSDARHAARRRACDDRDLAYAWPVTYCARDGVTGQLWKVRVDRVMQPAFVALDAIEVPAVHILWNGAALCSLPGMPKDWPPGHRWISLKDVADGAAVPADRCITCWDKAPALIGQLIRSAGADR